MKSKKYNSPGEKVIARIGDLKSVTAEKIVFDNQGTNLASVKVQEAIVEVNNKVEGGGGNGFIIEDGVLLGRANPVVIPDSVTSIGNNAFSNNQITELTIPDSVTSISDHAFSKNMITELTIPDSVTSIGVAVFSNNLITELTIPDSVTSIGNDAFSNNQITTVSVPFGKATEWETAFDNGVSIVERPEP